MIAAIARVVGASVVNPRHRGLCRVVASPSSTPGKQVERILAAFGPGACALTR